MKEIVYHRSPEGYEDPRQDELNFLAAILTYTYIANRKGEIQQEDYELIKHYIHVQEAWVRSINV